MGRRYFSILMRLWRHLSRHRRRQFAPLLVLTGVSALAEMLGLGIVFPFIGVLISPERFMAIPVVRSVMSGIGIETGREILFWLTAIFVFVTLAAFAVRLVLVWATSRLAFAVAGDLNEEVYRRTLYQPYIVHISRNSSEVIAGISTKVSHAMVFLQQTLVMISSLIVLAALVMTLIVIEPVTAISSGLTFAAAYLIISTLVKRRLGHNGVVLSTEAARTVKALQEGLGSARDTLLDGSQSYYCEVYADSNRRSRRAQAANAFITVAPRYVMESFGVTFIAILAYLLTVQNGMGQETVPVLGALAFGAQRMLPSLQAIYGAWASIIASEASVEDALLLLDQPIPEDAFKPLPAPLGLSKIVELKAVDFAYHDKSPFVLQKLDLAIRKGDRIGIVGTTGSGKSTLLDILMGLLQPTHGYLVVDGQPITPENILAWRQSIAHVPQSIFLADASIAENIALGMPKHSIDMERVKHAARQAQIAEMIESRPEGYWARIGERGVMLSGGQRQRIAIARALYKRASILILDEATSALDTATEREVMESVRGLDPSLTIMVVAHRLASVRDCHRVIRVEGGTIVASGTYEEMLVRAG